MPIIRTTVIIILAIIAIGVSILYSFYSNDSRNAVSITKKEEPTFKSEPKKTLQGPQSIGGIVGKIKRFAEGSIYIEKADGSEMEIKVDYSKPVYIYEKSDANKKMISLASLKVGFEINAQMDEKGNAVVIIIESE